MNKPIILLGNGGHAAVLTEILQLQNRKILGFTAPELQHNNYSLKYLGTDNIIETYSKDNVELVLAIGSIGVNKVRQSIFNDYRNKGYHFAIVKHPTAIISPTVEVGQGVQIMAGAIIQSQTQIADNCIINTGVIIEHNCTIEDHVHIAPGCKLAGNVTVGLGCHIGIGATIIQNMQVGHHSLVGAGAVVTRHVSEFSKVIGVPAKEV